MKITIPDQKKLEKLKESIKKDGCEKLFVLSDFDRTLTHALVGGIKTPSIISRLWDGNYLSRDYAKKAQALFEKYHPIEMSSSLSTNRKKEAMREWWDKHHELMIQSGLSKSDLEDVLKRGSVNFRRGVEVFLDFLDRQKIPLVIISASGCGDIVPMFFQKMDKNYPNIFFIVNQFNWNDSGRAVSLKGQTLHSLNKNEVDLDQVPGLKTALQGRRNALLLGDSPDDLLMAENFELDHLIKAGFLNPGFNSEDKFEDFFDIIIEEDGDFEQINQLVFSLE